MASSDWPGEWWVMTGMRRGQQVLGRVVEIISSTFELVNFEMPEKISRWRYQGGSCIYKTGAQRWGQLTDALLEVMSIWVVFKATGMDGVTWGGKKGD